MRTSGDGSVPRGRGAPLNRGRGRGAYQNRKMDIPKTDFDFETSNAKFNKDDLIKEAIATGSPIGDSTPDGSLNGVTESPAVNGSAEARKDSTSVPVYNKSSFFDDISSDQKDREAKTGVSFEGAFNGREKRGEEIRRNIETFGQGSVDGGFRGRGRGRGYRGGYGGRGGGYRGRGGYGYGQQRGYGYRGGYNGPRKTDEQTT